LVFPFPFRGDVPYIPKAGPGTLPEGAPPLVFRDARYEG